MLLAPLSFTTKATAINVACTNNGTWGFSENSELGNAYIGCFSQNNGVGNFLSGDSTSEVNDSVFIACRGFTKAEKAKIRDPQIFWGGHINPVPMDDATPPPIINDKLGHIFSSKVFRAIDNHGPIFFNTKKNPLLAENPDSEETPPPIRVRFRPNFKEQGNVYYFDDFVNGTGGDYRLNFRNDRFKFYHAAAVGRRDVIHFLGATAIRDTGDGQPSEMGAVQLAQGFFISRSREKENKRIRVNSNAPSSVNPDNPAIADTGADTEGVLNPILNSDYADLLPNDTGTKGDILFNSKPEVGGNVAWICIKSVVFEDTTPDPTITTPAVWKKIGTILP